MTEMTLVNLTPHKVNVYNESGSELLLEISPSGETAQVRLAETVVNATPILVNGNKFPVVHVGRVPGELPPLRTGVFYIVSSLVAEASRSRRDFLVPYPLLRDVEGKVIGCTGFSRPLM